MPILHEVFVSIVYLDFGYFYIAFKLFSKLVFTRKSPVDIIMFFFAFGPQKPFSPTSLRSTASTTHRQLVTSAAVAAVIPVPAGNKRRDSLSSSAGASSVRRLIEVVRTTPSNMGPVYSRRQLCRNYVTLCLGHGAAAAALVPFMALQVRTTHAITILLLYCYITEESKLYAAV